MAAFTDLDVLKEIPGYQAIMKGVLKNLIQILIEQLSMTTGEESVILTASINDGSLSHLGSELGKDFLQENEDFKSKFLGFCLRRQHMMNTTGSNTPKRIDNLQVQPGSLQKVTSVSQLSVKRRAGLSQSSPYFARRRSSTVSSSERQPSSLTEQASMNQEFTINDISEQTEYNEEPSQQTVTDDESSKEVVVKEELSEDIELTGVTYSYSDGTMTSPSVTQDSDRVVAEFSAEGGETSFDQTRWFQNSSIETTDLGNSPVETDNLNKPGEQVINKKDVRNKSYSQEEVRALNLLPLRWTCDICGHALTSNQALQRHMLTHTGEKPFKCPDCGKYFSRKDNMKQHMIIHLRKDNPFSRYVKKEQQ